KKLITDNSNIVDYNFYRPENIFIIGKDDPGRLKDFISSPYKKINQKIVDYYEFENWIKRFEGKEQK
ncbi:oligosaccharide biosynthesis protein Alg14, partial [Candidatus Saccharibacteria bacterium]|nr:oligosaccharide biosynthesis protein Alg14 [Candidatus Saccharibacteria bacterium]